jgi:hypothetical protein
VKPSVGSARRGSGWWPPSSAPQHRRSRPS